MNWKWPWTNFTPEEMACKHCGMQKVIIEFMDKLQALRDAMGRPLVINSGFRCAEHDKSIGGAGVHPTGRAVDIKIMGADADLLVKLSYEHGFTGRGIHQRGAWAGRYVHIDDLQGVKRPRIWSY